MVDTEHAPEMPVLTKAQWLARIDECRATDSLSTVAVFTCPVCLHAWRNSNDVAQRYCGGVCHWWTGDPPLLLGWLRERGLVRPE